MGTHSTGTNRKTVGEQLHFSNRVIAALHNEVFNSFPTLANEYSGPDFPTVRPSSAFFLLPSFVSQGGRVKEKGSL